MTAPRFDSVSVGVVGRPTRREGRFRARRVFRTRAMVETSTSTTVRRVLFLEKAFHA